MLEPKNKVASSLKKIRKISLIKEPEIKMVKLIVPQDDFDVKMKAEREMEMTTDLLAEAGVEEPKVFGHSRGIKTGIFLIIYLGLCTVIIIITRIIIIIYYAILDV